MEEGGRRRVDAALSFPRAVRRLELRRSGWAQPPFPAEPSCRAELPSPWRGLEGLLVTIFMHAGKETLWGLLQRSKVYWYLNLLEREAGVSLLCTETIIWETDITVTRPF